MKERIGQEGYVKQRIGAGEHMTGDGFFAKCPRLCRVLFIVHSVKRLFAEC